MNTLGSSETPNIEALQTNSGKSSGNFNHRLAQTHRQTNIYTRLDRLFLIESLWRSNLSSDARMLTLATIYLHRHSDHVIQQGRWREVTKHSAFVCACAIADLPDVDRILLVVRCGPCYCL